MKRVHVLRHTSVIVSLVAVTSLLNLTGCSVIMAVKQPPKRDLSVLDVGTPRGLVLAELGQPITSEMRNNLRVDLFSFTQGYSKPAKAGRALFHGAADVFTLGLWEVVGTPTEAVFNGKKIALEVTYDENEKIKKVVQLQKPAGVSEPTGSHEAKSPAKQVDATSNGNFAHR